MKFTHLVEINDPRNPLIEPLTHEQVWRGLVLRAQQPKMFVAWLDVCHIVQRSAASIDRELHYGDVVIRDSVNFLPPSRIHYHVPAQNDITTSNLTMTIEEPQPGSLFVRFEYDDGSNDAAGSTDAFFNEYRRSAYEEADIDTIRIIRQLAASGRLDATIM